MRQVTLSFLMVLLTCMLSTVTNIKINKPLHLNIEIKNRFHEVLGKTLHLQASKDFQDSQFFIQLINLINSDSEFNKSLSTGVPLPQNSTNKIKALFSGSNQFQNAIFAKLQSSNGNQCLNKLSKDQRKRFIQIVLNQIDFSTILSNPNQQLNNTQLQEIIAKAKADSQLSQILSTCIDKIALNHKKQKVHKLSQINKSHHNHQHHQDYQQIEDQLMDLNDDSFLNIFHLMRNNSQKHKMQSKGK